MSYISSSPDRIPGVDVSHFQCAINWPAVAKSGVGYCFMKATEGITSVDAYFKTNWSGAQAAGITRGAYHLFRPLCSPAAQAALFTKIVGALSPGDLPPVLDLEVPEDWRTIPLPNRIGLAVQWLEAVEKSLGIAPIVYVSPAFVTGILGDASALARFPLWIAQYHNKPDPMVPKPWSKWTFWQHTDKGQVSGIAGLVDHDQFLGSAADLRALLVPVPRYPSPSPDSSLTQETPPANHIEAALSHIREEFTSLVKLDRALTGGERARSRALDSTAELLEQALGALNERQEPVESAVAVGS